MIDYWPWWLGGIALATIPIYYAKKSFGVSGVLEKVLFKKETIDIAESEAFSCDEEAVISSLSGKSISETKKRLFLQKAKKHWLENVLLILGILIGGLTDALLTNRFAIDLSLSPLHKEMFGEGIIFYLVLLLGGFLIGIGTRFAGGCTSGHGLSGCGRLEKFSILSTAIFFGTAIIVTNILNFFLGVS